MKTMILSFLNYLDTPQAYWIALGMFILLAVLVLTERFKRALYVTYPALVVTTLCLSYSMYRIFVISLHESVVSL